MAYAGIKDGRVYIQTDWSEKELVKQLPGSRWEPIAKIWTAPLSWATCVMLRGIFGAKLNVGEDLNAWAFEERANRVDPAMELRGLTEPTTISSPPRFFDDPSKFLTRLYPFQRVGVSFLRVAGDSLLGDEMGTGKTVQVISALTPTHLPALVVCPNSVKNVWATEVERWRACNITPYVITSGATRKKVLEAAAADPSALVIVNYQAMRLLSRLAPYGSIRLKRCRSCDTQGEVGLKESLCEVHPKPLNQILFRTVIVDEAHALKDPQSKQTRATWAVMHGPTVERRWALTGTPIANHPGDLWSIMHGVNRDDFPSKSKFIDRYALTSWNAFGALDIVGIHPSTRDEFFKILDPRFRRMPKALVLSQLPPKVRSRRYVDMTPKQAKAYRELDEHLTTITTSGERITAVNELVNKVRLMQLSSSYADVQYVGDDVSIHMCEPSTKLDELEAILEELGDKSFVVAAESRQLIELASQRLTNAKVSHKLITGAVPEWERAINLKQFQEGQVRGLLFTVKAGGVGLTMTKSDTIIFLQRSWSMIDNKQAEDRVHRIGSEGHESIQVIDIICRDSVEEDQLTRLYEKLERLEEITRDRATLLAAGQTAEHLDDVEANLMGVLL